MSIYTNSEVTEFCFEGRFLDFVIKDGYKLKGLLLWTSEGECYIKLAKHLRSAFDLRLLQGTWLQVVGTKQYNAKKDQVTLVAERVMAASADMGTVTAQNLAKTKPDKVQTILVCQKSDCMKRGGKALCQALESELTNHGLENSVAIKGTGCMKNCKAGPNLVMPDKTRYSKVKAEQVADLIDKHFSREIREKRENIMVNIPTFVEV
ncbi:(2Fe-2S) ferredoxin domain-containing protein [Dolichospermum circinale CS-1225]|uniref:(2Fe-2S) ferredoxin domain-containing protein n=1 Tax=Dolichospermum circinale CS-537/01 TaxID=3021739 RepID=A0ABT5A683_9CYAN|nr:(2Fe-2S) ferredoxin domain-containing protein [Dolichospermum circinale]MDB9457501.1 (2Fe-2S) ferredoxin domain-containing protein [Dolichospermum circinale CS-545/17]MDB9465934.1 (2Fe-2S) ferredoxin domain-containing protein [Dolichospermum circinale CS-539/09]MDB9471102.1 (2Fe-2S) ferredoxin domain-containing protein [Dolichospermum circinale CS-539]MDB9487462.1 (2Fe-2S) ferredoxin domain-containing protein [Dolichospermum circinale CS-537/01]MDB9521618.1 (2Fe-2S) ferredoxin domain-contai